MKLKVYYFTYIMMSCWQDYITFHATERVSRSLDKLIDTEEWNLLDEFVFEHILRQQNLSISEGQLFKVDLSLLFVSREVAIPQRDSTNF